MKLNWVDHEAFIGHGEVEAEGTDKRYYQVWWDGTQYFGDVDNCELCYGSKEDCINACQAHEDMIQRRFDKIAKENEAIRESNRIQEWELMKEGL